MIKKWANMNKNSYQVFVIALLAFTNSYALSIDEQTSILKAHNHFRKQHHAAPLTWSDELAEYAEKHAAHCHFKHSFGPYGENLAAGYPTAAAAIQGWYSESSQYSYNHPEFSHTTGHFTQLIWKSSTQIGCALVSCNGENGTPGKFLVCEYNPPGNVVGEEYFRENVRELRII